MPAILGIVLGLSALILGAEMVVRGGTALAMRVKVPPIIVGGTVVSVGTSVPELAVGIDAAARGDAALAVGNIAGTNMVNILLILGMSAALRPLPISPQTLRLDLPGMVVAAGAFVLVALDGQISTGEGVVMVTGAVAYMILAVRGARRAGAVVVEEYEEEFTAPASGMPRRAAMVEVLTLLAGIGVIVLGAEWLVDGSVVAARTLGVSEAVIGLTVIAIGTSAPELITTVVSTLRDERDIAIGNLIGSSVLNILLILGVTTIVVPGTVPVARETRVDRHPVDVRGRGPVSVRVPHRVTGVPGGRGCLRAAVRRLPGGSAGVPYLIGHRQATRRSRHHRQIWRRSRRNRYGHPKGPLLGAGRSPWGTTAR